MKTNFHAFKLKSAYKMEYRKEIYNGLDMHGGQFELFTHMEVTETGGDVLSS